ncbi:MAG: ComF family protein [Candidatus Ratteibacteria bacterium]|nr:ComF family protein [Candidatus Ratteibacteria bacterium]
MLSTLLNLLFPSYCLICEKKVKQSDYPVCQDCLAMIKPLSPAICRVGGPAALAKIFFFQARAAGIYEGILKKMIHLFKYKKKTSLARPLSDLLLKFLEGNPLWIKVDYFVPVPLTQRRLRERGFNQAEYLARRLAMSLNIKLSVNNLKRKGSSSSQVKAGREERNKNVAGAFYLAKPEIFRGKKILLIDDVFTTGSTANACARVLREGGSKEVLVLTAARAG